ncbi:hypothetical protein HS088_TW09G01216 [Tripterygium wilfordii]|uniref:Uncharacterized protein n=1 Tax=Tripterygium wilfordii TaxID=458696 RepID=A0A7J7DA21_TRIWF|nr:hypothetical protein HS088_TW09G01216 [Tripterygium wilfordii]
MQELYKENMKDRQELLKGLTIDGSIMITRPFLIIICKSAKSSGIFSNSISKEGSGFPSTSEHQPGRFYCIMSEHCRRKLKNQVTPGTV